jgi:hypothetical protein
LQNEGLQKTIFCHSYLSRTVLEVDLFRVKDAASPRRPPIFAGTRNQDWKGRLFLIQLPELLSQLQCGR